MKIRQPQNELKNEEIEDSGRNDLVEGPAADMSKSGVIYKIIDKVKQNKLQITLFMLFVIYFVIT